MSERLPSSDHEPRCHLLKVSIDYFTAFTIEEYMQEKKVNDAQAVHDLVDLALAAHVIGEDGYDFEFEYPEGEMEYLLPSQDLAARFKDGPKQIEVKLVERLYDAMKLLELERKETPDQIMSYLIGLVRPLHIQRRKGAVTYKVSPDGEEYVKFPFQ